MKKNISNKQEKGLKCSLILGVVVLKIFFSIFSLSKGKK